MKGLSSKFANLNRPGIARQLVKGGDAADTNIQPTDKAPVVSPKPAAGAKPKFDRAAYQRTYMKEYMRKRRAKDKGNEGMDAQTSDEDATA